VLDQLKEGYWGSEADRRDGERGSPVESWVCISPDGRWLLYAQVDQTDGDITLVENFR